MSNRRARKNRPQPVRQFPHRAPIIHDLDTYASYPETADWSTDDAQESADDSSGD